MEAGWGAAAAIAKVTVNCAATVRDYEHVSTLAGDALSDAGNYVDQLKPAVQAGEDGSVPEVDAIVAKVEAITAGSA